MEQLMIVFYIIDCVALVALVLLQQGKGADLGAAFGSGASSTVFGSQGSSSFLFKLTAALATLFFVMSLALAYMVTSQAKASQQALLPTQQPVTTTPVQKKNTDDTLVLPVDSAKPKSNKNSP